ncbi:MAG TPA: His/Gly/Thr/Pro-type tRNA ligase C-terminal domain-containing protein, partial [Ktedonobacteraceae bacterium]|nr:His/Gly/Thr/Pro-type tRNA ligase C-terminal domain-containing protein [Ktedonobacteraceae bacterium]
TGLVFEIHAQDEDGFDAQLCGGGRYDHLVRAVGSTRDVNACGFAFGVERLLPPVPAGEHLTEKATKALVIPVSDQDLGYALQVARLVRTAGARVEVDVSGHGVGAGLRLAAKKQARFALIVGEDEQQANTVTLRDLATGAEEVLDSETIVRRIAREEQST